MATYALVDHAIGSTADTNSATAGPFDSTLADIIHAHVASYGAQPVPVLTDSKGNVWHALTSHLTGTTRSTLYWCQPTTKGTGHTVTATGAGSYPTIAIAAFSGSVASPFDVENGASGSGTPLAPGSITPGADNELVICGVAFALNDVASINGGFSITDQTNYNPGVWFGCGLAYLIQTTAAAANPSWSWGSAADAAASIAAFKNTVGGGGGGGTVKQRRRQNDGRTGTRTQR